METPEQKSQKLHTRERVQHRRKARFPFLVGRFTPIFRLFAILGPGLIAANAGNDAGGVATYSSAGAAYGYNLLWALAITTIFVGCTGYLGHPFKNKLFEIEKDPPSACKH